MNSMRAVIQRVNKANVKIEKKVVGRIGNGILVLLAVHKNDSIELIEKLVKKLVNLRIFSDQNGKMNKSIKDVDGEILVVSQFTLYGDVKKGNRPSFINSAKPDKAKPFYKKFISLLKEEKIFVATGEFGRMMKVSLINDGPVTIIIDI